MRVTFRVSFELPKGATRRRAREYVDEAVRFLAGGLDPNADPFFDLDQDSVRVAPVRTPKPKRKP